MATRRNPRLTLWRKIFRGKDYTSTVVEQAIEAQALFERDHRVPYAIDQRRVALRQRVQLATGSTPTKDMNELLEKALLAWSEAAQAAKEIR